MESVISYQLDLLVTQLNSISHSRLTSSRLTSSKFISPGLTSFGLTSPGLTSFGLTSPGLTNSRLFKLSDIELAAALLEKDSNCAFSLKTHQ